ncbi:MAG: histidine--tRNA ligase [Fimbriimonadales bacterium]
MRFQAQRGTSDVLPAVSHRWQRLEEEFRDLCRIYGYEELRTPTFEDLELFTHSSGETSDIVSKEMYDFTDKGGRRLALKPEGTAPAIRAVIEHNLCPLGQIARLYYITPVFRYGRPQKGRLRESHQVGLELIGSPNPAADAEIIEMTYRFYEKIGIDDVEVALNSIGRAQARARYREVVLKHFAEYLKGQDEETRTRYEQNPLRLLDSKDPDAAEIKATITPILDYLEDESRANFETVQSLLLESGVRFQIAPDIVRGLDYYTDTVFEIVSSKLGAQSSLCGGGRYDNLVKDLGGSPTPSVGVAMGIERALIVLEESGKSWDEELPEVYVVQATPDAAAACRKLLRELRAAGVTALGDIDGRKMSAQLKSADRLGAQKAIFIGADELARGTVILRDLATSQQEEMAIENALPALRGSAL